MTRVGVAGAGYVGATTAACLAELGHHVTCADIDPARVERLRRADVPFLESGLAELVARHLWSGRLRFETETRLAAEGADVLFLCVPTPEGPDGAADTAPLEDAARTAAPCLPSGAVLVTKSTAPVGSAFRLGRIVQDEGRRTDVAVVVNPEFFREGTAVADFLHPDRIVIGADDPAAGARLRMLYRDIDAPVVLCDPASAEMIKYAANAYLACRVSFINSIANLCERMGADVEMVVEGMRLDPRIGPSHLHPGPGFGGACLPKDSAALLQMAAQSGEQIPTVKAAIKANAAQRERITQKIQASLGTTSTGARVAMWGLTFKAETDDLRCSPALDVAARLIADGATVRAYDPAAAAVAREIGGIEVVDDPYEACRRARTLAILTDWDEFRRLDLRRVRQLMTKPAVVDARNLLDPGEVHRLGFIYTGVGRVAHPSVAPDLAAGMGG